MGDFIVSNFKDNYNRGREGGGGSNYMVREENPVWNEDSFFSKKKKETRNMVGFVIDNVDRNKRKVFNIELLELLIKIESRHQKKNRFTLILCMCFCVDFATLSFDRYGKEKLNLFLKSKWKEMTPIISNSGKNVEIVFRDRRMLIHSQIYKCNVIAGSDELSRYIGIWEQEIQIFQYKMIQTQNNKRELLSSSSSSSSSRVHTVERVNNIPEYSIVKGIIDLDVILNIQADNGRNACYINTVLFLWACNPFLKDLMVHNRFFDQHNRIEIQSMLSHKWGDALYLKYYNVFKKERLMDIPESYGEFSHPHTIINFMSESIFRNSGIHFNVDVDSIYNLTTFVEFQEFLKRNSKDKQLLGIIKTVEQIPVDLPLNDSKREESGYHYVSFFMIHTNQFILFDALKNGVVTGCMTEKQVYQFYYPDRPKLKVKGAFTFFFIWMTHNKK